MKNLKIGYWPLSQNMKSAGDRRRIVSWAKARGHEIVTDLTQNLDVIVASENSDFNSMLFEQEGVPVIFDLVDAYLSPLNVVEDLSRGLAKKFAGQISGAVKPFSNHVRDFCFKSNAVICSSVEQEEIISKYNKNTHVILDCHDEIPFSNPSLRGTFPSREHGIFWEGQPATIRGVKQIAPVLAKLSHDIGLRLEFVTDEMYLKLLNRYFERSTIDLLKADLRQVNLDINLVPWSLDNLVKSAQRSAVAMIPIDLSVPMQRLKPENRLLIMWRLGLPCLTSPSPAYKRVSKLAGLTVVCENPDSWYDNFRRLLDDPYFSLEEVRRGQNYLREHHASEVLFAKWDRAIESVTG